MWRTDMGRGIGFSVRIVARFDEKKTWLNIYIYINGIGKLLVYIYILLCARNEWCRSFLLCSDKNIIIKSLFIYFYYYYFRWMTMMENCKAIFASVYTIITVCAMCVCVCFYTINALGYGGGYRIYGGTHEVNGFYFAATTQRF